MAEKETGSREIIYGKIAIAQMRCNENPKMGVSMGIQRNEQMGDTYEVRLNGTLWPTGKKR